MSFWNKDKAEEFFLSSVGSIFQADGNRWLIKLIQPGWSLNGTYFSEEFLEKFAHKWEAGHPAFVNHPNWIMGRSPLDLVGQYKTQAIYDPFGPKGEGLYAEVEVSEEFGKFLDEFGEMVDVSIYAVGKSKQGKVDGRKGRIAVSLEKAISTDFVAHGAAGGSVINKVKPKITIEEDENSIIKEEKMFKEKYEALMEKHNELEANIKEREKEIKTIKADMLKEKASVYALTELERSDYNPKSKERIVDSFVSSDSLNEATFESVFQESVQKEQAILATVNTSPIKKMGSAGDEGQDISEELAAEFKVMGSTEEAAIVAARGR